jgi:aspartyl-tRNA(Asn)/glutamyl-tRNA(Gln) amidotransferase subunit A
MTELAYEPSGYNALRGRTLNPWNEDFVSGGSSSGSAALVACAAVFLGLGSDTGGSIRMPAACCGVTGLKPTAGAIPVQGAMVLASSLDTVGLFARSASDLEAIWPVLAGRAPDTPDPVETAVVFVDAVDSADAEIRGALSAGIAALDGAGLHIRFAVMLGLIAEADRHALIIMQAEAARAHVGNGPGTAHLSDTLHRRLEKGLAISDQELTTSLAERARLEGAFADVLGQGSIAVLPVMPIATPLAAQTDPASKSFAPRMLYRMSSLTRFVNYLGWPAISVPVGFDARGLPVGLQLLGGRGSEEQLLRVVRRLQAITDWHTRRPAITLELA